MKRILRILVALCTMLFGSLTISAQAAATTPLSDFEYIFTSPGDVLLTCYVGKSDTVAVPGAYMIDGVSYRVTLASETVFFGNTRIKSVSLASGVGFQNDSMRYLLGECSNLQNVQINAPDTSMISDMSYLFHKCERLQTVDLSGLETGAVSTMRGMFGKCTDLSNIKGLENWDTSALTTINYMFDQTPNLRTIDLSNWTLANLENSGWCFQSTGAKKILLPDDLAVISAGFLNHVDAYAGNSFVIPTGVKKVGCAHTFYDFGTNDFVEFVVAEGNTAYKADNGILYSADGSQMLAIPRAKTFPGSIYQIPEGITFLGELSFSRNYNIETVVLPNSYCLQYVPQYDPAYIIYNDTGNLNVGLNLHIAIYCYTGITQYAVKEDNPNYSSVDGVIYNKDMTQLLAVPSKYRGKLEIPEGVVSWQQYAMWNSGETVDSLMEHCSGVVIPASMTEISQDQFRKLNRLESRFSGFTINVSPDNPVFYVGKDGQLQKYSSLADAEITMEQKSVVYDGTQKKPIPTVLYNGKLLVEGKDYTLEYTDNIAAGTARIQIIGCGSHYGTEEITFSILPAQPVFQMPENCTAFYGQKLQNVSLPDGFVWKEPQRLLGETGMHVFEAVYSCGDSNYSEVNCSITVTVTEKAISNEDISVVLWYPWMGRAIQPQVVVVDETGAVPQEEYTLQYENNFWPGKGTVILQDISGGNYIVEGMAEFYIVPGPFSCIALLTALWCVTTGPVLAKYKKSEQSKKRQRNQ